MAVNNGLLFYKKNYNQTTGELINSIQINTKIESSGISEIEIPKFSNTFSLETTYPGLLMGTGYTHHAKGDDVDNAFKIGFFFDHTTGMPIIPGSSLKGVLRSVFPQFDKEDLKKTEKGEIPKNTRSIVKARWISTLIAEIKKVDFNPDTFIKTYYQPNEEFSDFKLIHLFELELFDTAKNIFHDAIPLKIIGNNKANEAKLFATDYITRHENPLKNPEPLKFLKVLPKVVYQFTFKLHTSKIEPLLTAEKIEFLFKKILLTIGIGAKTNVGYGQFASNNGVQNARGATTAKLNQGISLKDLKVGDVIDARIADLSSAIVVELDIKDISFKPRLTGLSTKGYVKNQLIKLKIEQIGKLMKFSVEPPK